MASRRPGDNAREPRRVLRGAAVPGPLQTQNLQSNHRFSYAETPLQMQPATFQQFSSPTNSTIDESPIDFTPHQQTLSDIHEYQARSPYPVEKSIPDRVNSPYSIATPAEPHPALSAPYADAQTSFSLSTTVPYQSAQRYPVIAPDSSDARKYQGVVAPSTTPSHATDRDRKGEEPKLVHTQPTLTYNPYSPTGPNASLASHRPGQVAHPNSQVDPQWKHGMCEADSLCCIGLFCPCMVYGKTQYRLTQKAQKREATDLLGYESVNSSCGLMAVACGFQCKSHFGNCMTERLTFCDCRDLCRNSTNEDTKVI